MTLSEKIITETIFKKKYLPESSKGVRCGNFIWKSDIKKAIQELKAKYPNTNKEVPEFVFSRNEMNKLICKNIDSVFGKKLSYQSNKNKKKIKGGSKHAKIKE